MIPPELAPYSGLITLVLMFVDGAIFGIAAKKAVKAAVYFLAGIILAGVIGISLPLPPKETVLEYLARVLEHLYANVGPITFGLPAAFILGFLFALVKG